MSSEKTASGGRSASDKSGTSKSAAAQAGGRKSSGAAPKSRPRRTSQRPPIKRRTNVLQAAEMQQLREAFLAAAGRCTIASIGPTCSDALESAGLRVDVEASPPKMGQLVRQALRLAD